MYLFVQGCGGSDFCPFEVFKVLMLSYSNASFGVPHLMLIQNFLLHIYRKELSLLIWSIILPRFALWSWINRSLILQRVSFLNLSVGFFPSSYGGRMRQGRAKMTYSVFFKTSTKEGIISHPFSLLASTFMVFSHEAHVQLLLLMYIFHQYSC